jgi:hypothetical protein
LIRFSEEQFVIDSIEIALIKEAFDSVLYIRLDQIFSVKVFSCSVNLETMTILLMVDFAGKCVVGVFEPRSEL